jgi:MCP family monocarboxylic acid transporter-like MFS transporter 10
MSVTNSTIRRRLPPSSLSGGLFNVKQFRSPVFTVYTAAGVVVFLGINTHDVVLTSQGVPESFSSYLVSIANAGNTVGRLVSGILTNHLSTSCSHPLPIVPISL